MSAVISECGKYRYVLRRSLNSVLRWHRPALFIMLNPSTADAEQDDPTIRRCKWFAEREGMTHLTVVNLFALRATDPRALKLSADPIGPENDMHLAEQIGKHKNSLVIAAWGSHAFAHKRAHDLLEAYGPLYCLGTSKNGDPRHPLYLKRDAPLALIAALDTPRAATNSERNGGAET